jgi:hypothetical protein
LNATDVDIITATPGTSLAATRLNVLWFSSLTCSLLAALGAVLAKQWMVEYPRGAFPSATPCERAQHRQIRFDGITAWHFLAVIDFLPSLIQMSFILFFAGLCDLLFSLDTVVGWVVAVPCGLGFLFILFTHVAAMIYPSCPFRTPLAGSLSRLITLFVEACKTFAFGPAEERSNMWYRPTGWRRIFIRGWKRLRYGHPDRRGSVPGWAANTASLAEDAQLYITNAKALAWLLGRVASEDVVVNISSLIPVLPTTELRTGLADALPRLCTLFQAYFTIDGDMDCLSPKIVPKDGRAENIKVLGRAIHRIMLRHPINSPAGRATRVIGDIFGDAFLVFPPRGIDSDLHALVCSLFTADVSYHRRYSVSVREQLFLSLLKYDLSPWALTMVLDSLCIYLQGCQPFEVTEDFRHAAFSQLTQILQRLPLSADVSSAVGCSVKVLVDGTLDADVLLDGKVEYLPRNLLLAVTAWTNCLQNQRWKTYTEKRSLDNGLSAVLRAIKDFASDKELRASFLDVRRDMMASICQLLLLSRLLSSDTVVSIVAVLDCYPDEVLSLDHGQAKEVLSVIITQLRPGHPDDDLMSILNAINRLIDIQGETAALDPPKNCRAIGKSLVGVLARSESDALQLAVLQSLARHAGFWFERGGLNDGLISEGICGAIISLLSSDRSLPEDSLTLPLVITDHIAPVSPMSLLQADPGLSTLNSMLKCTDLGPYTHQRCISVMLRIVQHLPTANRVDVLKRSEFLRTAVRILEDDLEVGEYLIKDWCEMSEVISRTHATILADSGFLCALRKSARDHGYGAAAEWIPEDGLEWF